MSSRSLGIFLAESHDLAAPCARLLERALVRQAFPPGPAAAAASGRVVVIHGDDRHPTEAVAAIVEVHMANHVAHCSSASRLKCENLPAWA